MSQTNEHLFQSVPDFFEHPAGLLPGRVRECPVEYCRQDDELMLWESVVDRANDLGSINLRDDDIPDYLDWIIENCPGAILFNHATRESGLKSGIRFPDYAQYHHHLTRWR